MPNPPRDYDDIVRATVPEPDSSWRPTKQQEQVAREGYRALDADEQQLLERVTTALSAAGMDASNVQVEIDRDHVVLRGHVRDQDAMMKIPAIVGQVDGVSAVVDQLVIAR